MPATASSMEESDLLKERVQAITEKHHIQELIRLKKLELDKEKLKLQHLKKKNLREKWLLQDSAGDKASVEQKQQSLLYDQQQTRTLQLNIHSIEMDILSLEREESRISINGSLILNRLKAVEKSPEEIIREVQANFVPEPLQVFTLSPESVSPSVNTESNTPKMTLFAMEINMTENLLTGKSTIPSISAVSPEELNEHTGHKGSNDMSCISKLTASEVEHLLKSATIHHQINHQNSSSPEQYLYKHHDEGDSRVGLNVRNHRGQYDIYSLSKNTAEKGLSHKQKWKLPQNKHHQESSSSSGNIQWGCHHNGNYEGERLYCGNQIDNHYSTATYPNGFISSNRRGDEGRPNCCPPSSHHQELGKAYQPQLGGYNNVDEEKYYYSPPYQTENCHKQSTALYHGPTSFGRLPSLLYGDDTPYTIINTLDTTEPITAIFMGFQAAEDDSGQSQEFVGSLKAELVIIEDKDECNDVKRNKSHAQSGVSSYSTERPASENVGHVERLGNRQTEKHTAQGIRNVKIHKPCCAVC